MKLNHIITLCAMTAALALGSTSLLAQDNGGGGGQPGGGQNGGDQNGGQRRNRGNFDPAQMQQRMMDNIQDQLGFTNDTDWEAVKPLVQKVLDARRDVGFGGGMRALFRPRGGNGGGNNRGGGMFGPPPGPEQEALQNALDANAPASQIKDLLARYKKVQKAKQAKLEAAQADLKSVLTARQEAQAYLLDLVN